MQCCKLSQCHKPLKPLPLNSVRGVHKIQRYLVAMYHACGGSIEHNYDLKLYLIIVKNINRLILPFTVLVYTHDVVSWKKGPTKYNFSCGYGWLLGCIQGIIDTTFDYSWCMMSHPRQLTEITVSLNTDMSVCTIVVPKFTSVNTK